MTDLERDITNDFSRKIAASKDELIRQQLDKYFGPQHWSLEDLGGRASVQVISGVETFYIDGEPLVEFHPPEANSKKLELGGSEMNISFKYRLLM